MKKIISFVAMLVLLLISVVFIFGEYTGDIAEAKIVMVAFGALIAALAGKIGIASGMIDLDEEV